DEMEHDVNGRFDEMEHDVNGRFDEMKRDMDHRFDETKLDADRRFDSVEQRLGQLAGQQLELTETVAVLAGTIEGIKPHLEHLDRLTERLAAGAAG
ncbi:MAG TPA: hypothetical protein VIR57_21635, partial [Chloroflexota bacterium]